MLIGILVILLPSKAFAKLPDGYVDDPTLTVYCKGVGLAMVAVSQANIYSRAITVILGAKEYYDVVVEGEYSPSAKCSMSFQDWNNYYIENPIDYNEFVREQCYGNPLNCPGTLNVGDPTDCSTFIVCSDYSGVVGSGGFSFNDLVAPFGILEMQIQYNSWQGEKHELYNLVLD